MKERRETATAIVVELEREEEARLDEPPTPEPAGECIVCRGQLVPDEHREFDARRGPMVIGHGSKSQYRTVRNGWYCVRCGIKYKHLPSHPPDYESDEFPHH